MLIHLIDFEIPEELKAVVSEFGCYGDGPLVKIIFTDVYDKVSINFIVTTKNIQKSFDEFEKRLRKLVPNISDHHFNLIENIIIDNFLINNSNKLSEENGEDRDKGNIKRRVTVNKYSQNRRGSLFESILLDGEPLFLNLNEKGEITLQPYLEEKTRVLYPPSEDEYLHQPYQFESKQEIETIIKLAEKETIFTLFRKARSIVLKYVEQEDHLINLISINTIFSYFQDRFSTVHYVGIFGDNGTGKSSIGDVAEATFYRSVNTTDPTGPNIYRSLGNVEPGQITLVLDEAERIDQFPDMISTLKSGYALNKKISRINSNTSKPEQFFAYCLKMIIGERPPGPNIAKGINERILGDVVYFGNPQYDIKEILNPTDTGGEEFKKAQREITEFRKLLFICRMLHFNDHIKNIDVGLTGRNKELVKPYLQLFSHYQTEEDKQIYHELENTFKTLLRIKNNKKDFSLEYALIPLILELMEESKKRRPIRFSDLWDLLQHHIRGKLNENKPNEYNTEDYGTIYRNTFSSTLHKIGVGTKRHNSYIELLFDRKKIRKTASQYGIIIQEKIDDKNSERSERSERSIDPLVENNPIVEENQSKYSPKFPTISNENGLNNDKNDLKDTWRRTSEENKDGPPYIEPSQHTQHSPRENDQDTTNSRIYRIGKTDTWGCEKCNLRGDKWFMQKHACRGS